MYNTRKDDLIKVIRSYSPCIERKLFLIDNSLHETDLAFLDEQQKEHVSYLFNNRNIGYGSAHNIALRRAIAIGSEYHIILNPDILFSTAILEEIYDFMDSNKEVAYLLPKVLYPNGDIQYLCKLLPNPFQMFSRRFLPKTRFTQRVDNEYTLKCSGYNKIINPPCLSGCFMFLRVSAIKENNLYFDERFFMYYEDFDLIRRIHRIHKTVYYPGVSIIHNHGRLAYYSKKMLFHFIVSTVKYFNKYGWFFDRERTIMNNKIKAEIQKQIW